jgi:hypothetical protein
MVAVEFALFRSIKELFIRTAIWGVVAPITLPAPPVTGIFTGDGKPAKLAFATALKGEPFNDRPTIVLVFTEKDHSTEKRPEIAAGLGNFGSALVLTIKTSGEIIGCQVAHSALSKGPFSSTGVIQMKEFKIEKGEMAGKISTDGPQESLGQKWEVDLTFRTRAP